MENKVLFEPVRIGKLELKNRFMMATTKCRAIEFTDEAEDAISCDGISLNTRKRGAW